MTLRRRDRHRYLTSWSVVLAFLLGALAGAVLELGASTSLSAGVSAAERGTDPSAPGTPDPAWLEDFDPAQHPGNLAGPEAALGRCVDAAYPCSGPLAALTLASWPVKAAQVRDGRSRAPPFA